MLGATDPTAIHAVGSSVRVNVICGHRTTFSLGKRQTSFVEADWMQSHLSQPSRPMWFVSYNNLFMELGL